MRKTGFTLVELIVVIVLIGIVALIAAPHFFSQPAFDASRLHESAISTIRYGQKIAVAQRANVFVVSSANTLALCFDAACTARVKTPGSSDDYVVNIPSGIGITSSSFNFNSLGQPIPNAQTIFTISGDGTSRQIVVEQETGYVHR